MRARTLIVFAALALAAACNRDAPQQSSAAQGPQLEAPAPEAEPARAFMPANPAATAASGALTMSITTRMPDAAEAEQGAAAHDVLMLTGANHLVLEAETYSTVSPATQVDRQTVRALMALPVDAAQLVVYKVSSETKPESGQGVCGADAPAYVLVWEPATPGDASLKIMGVTAAAPGQSGAHACPSLIYRRQ
ncbi:MAG TPA: hypothetical protein VG841_15910 [Caulobacterales bacterium]|nr:hypothetical protein [Caulobacterales bacterium]